MYCGTLIKYTPFLIYCNITWLEIIVLKIIATEHYFISFLFVFHFLRALYGHTELSWNRAHIKVIYTYPLKTRDVKNICSIYIFVNYARLAMEPRQEFKTNTAL